MGKRKKEERNDKIKDGPFEEEIIFEGTKERGK